MGLLAVRPWQTTTEFLPSFFTNGTGTSRAPGDFNSRKKNLPFYTLSKFLSQNHQLPRAPALIHQHQHYNIAVSSVPTPTIVVVVVAILAATSAASWTRPLLRPFNLRVSIACPGWTRFLSEPFIFRRPSLDAFSFETV